MVETQGADPDIAVLVDRSGEGGRSGIDWESLRLPVAGIESFEEGRANRAVENLAQTVVLDGDDRLASRAVTAYQRRHVGRDRPVQFVPLKTGRFHRLAEDVGGPAPTRRLAKLLADEGVPEHWTQTRRPSLRVTTSARPAPYWGFSLGVGAVFELFETLQRAEGMGWSGWSSVGSKLLQQFAGGEAGRLEPDGARLSVDYEPRSEQLGYLLASSLATTWSGISTGDVQPAWMGGDTPRHFLKKVAGSAAIPAILRGGGAEAFDRIHVDGPGGFVLDGTLFDPGEPHVLQVASGPTMRFATP